LVIVATFRNVTEEGRLMLERVRVHRPSPAMVVAVIALVGAFGGSAIADQAVDLAKRAKLISGAKIKKRSIRGNRVKRNTLTGTEIRESKLGIVPRAETANSAKTADSAKNADNANAVNGVSEAQFTLGRSAKGSCNPTDATKVACASVSLTLPRAGRVLVVANSMWHSNFAGIARGSCNVAVDGNDLSGDVFPGQVSNNSDSTHESSLGVNFVSDSVASGAHTFALTCNQLQNDIQFNESFISAVMIGSA
jgi:hypothetical protein